MIKKHLILVGVVIAVVLLFIATLVYPGGSYFNNDTVGFDWSENFMSNLFAEKAINGLDNPARYWADSGMIFLAASYAVFFTRFSKKIPSKSAANVIKYSGVTAMVCKVLIVTPLHDIMVTLAGILYLVSLFYITVFVLKSKLHVFKFLCVTCMLLLYFTFYVYGAGYLTILVVMQKLTFLSTATLFLGLEYFTSSEDFKQIKTSRVEAK